MTRSRTLAAPAALATLLAACGGGGDPIGGDPDAMVAGPADAMRVGDGEPATGTPAPTGGWPVSSRCAVETSGGCDVVEAETWSRSGLASLVRDPDTNLVRLLDPGNVVLVEIEPGAWFAPSGLTATPDGGWVFAGAAIGPAPLRVGADLIPLPNDYNRIIARVDAGAVTWSQVIAGASDERAWVAARTDASIAVTGEQMIDTTLGTTTLEGPNWVYDFFAAALTADGDWAWAIELPTPPTAVGDFDVQGLALGPHSETIAPGALRGTLSLGGATVTGPVQAEATASETGEWLSLVPVEPL